uniref:Uncharacterized protein n=1 Tax=Anguilla anguilla TaxID=7936 RepID=A0A0E9V4W0_ANGAN
MATSHHKLS